MGLGIPQMYQQAEQMALLSKKMKEIRGDFCCVLPFCHTVEAEALGGSVNYGDEKAGPRAGEAVITSVDHLQKLPMPQLDRGRIFQVLKAARILSDAGETVILNVAGPLSVLNGLADFSLILRAMHKKPEIMEKALGHIEGMLLDYMKKAGEYGVGIISYADPGAGADILGQKLAFKMLSQFTSGFLRKADENLENNILLMLCPKISLAFTSTGYGYFRDVPVKEGESYVQACKRLRGQVRFAGTLCAGDMEKRLSGNCFKELCLFQKKEEQREFGLPKDTMEGRNL